MIKLKNIIQISGIILLLTAVGLFSGCNTNNSGSTDNTVNPGNSATSGAQPEEKVEIGSAAPDFSVELLSGETFKLSDYRGKAVLVNFWATWCPPCVGEMPEIQKLSEAYADNLVIIGINCGDKKDTVDNFIKKNSYTFNIGIDEKLKLQEKYPSDGIPYSVIINPDGIITGIQLGVDPKRNMYDVYEEYVKTALNMQ